MAILTYRGGVLRGGAVLACWTLAWTGTGNGAVPSRTVVVRYEDAKFTPIDPSQPEGPQIAGFQKDWTPPFQELSPLGSRRVTGCF